ncbi:MAG TPA: ZIP family metal transporter [Vicinamibacteria bacterium]|nr:ZIP family metal transporter [Vicinamibacteria bacterium]
MNPNLSAASAACAVTLLSGLLALHFREHRVSIYAFCSGALIGGVVLLLLPDAMQLLQDSEAALPKATVWIVATLGFFVFYVLDRGEHRKESRRLAGLSGGIGIAIHAFIDGVVIGQGFRAGETTGAAVAFAVLLHKLADGVGAVGVMLGTEHSIRQTLTLLAITAVAPLLGIWAQSRLVMPVSFLALLLSLFAGMLLYLAASRLLPEAMRNQTDPSSVPLIFLAGLAFVYAAHLLS